MELAAVAAYYGLDPRPALSAGHPADKIALTAQITKARDEAEARETDLARRIAAELSRVL